MEAIGDITASAEVSRVAVHGEEFDSRIQGGVLVGSPSLEGSLHSSSLSRVTPSADSSQHSSLSLPFPSLLKYVHSARLPALLH